MTERLEEIKSRVWKDKGTYAMGDYSQREGYIYTLSDYDYEWLVKQAERAQWLEKELKHQTEHFSISFDLLENQNKRYREVLKNIYELAEYNEYDNTIEQIVSEIEKALEGEE